MKSEKGGRRGEEEKEGGGVQSGFCASRQTTACIYSQTHNNRTADQHQAQLRPGDISPAPTQTHLAGGGNNDWADVPTTDCPDDELTSPDQAGN